MGRLPVRLRPDTLRSSLWALLIAVWVRPLWADSPEQWKARFLNEAPPAWEKYRTFAEGLQGSVEYTMTVKGGKYTGKPYLSSRLEFKSNPTCKLLLVQQRGPEQLSGTLEAFNSVYAFTLKRKTAEASWVLADLRIGAKGYNAKEWEDKGWDALFPCISIGDPLADLLRQPTFRVVRATPVQRDGGKLLQIDFDNTHPWNAKPLCSIQAGTLLLDPERLWTLRGYTLQEKPGGQNNTRKVEFELRDPASKYPIPKRSLSVLDQPEREEGHLVVTLVTDYNLSASPPTGEEEFTFAARWGASAC
jgi:hypothetical protein